jgi:hypothetical protein
MKVDEQYRPGKIDDAAPVVAVNTLGKVMAGWAGAAGGNGVNLDDQLMSFGVDDQTRDTKACAGWEEIGQQIHPWPTSSRRATTGASIGSPGHFHQTRPRALRLRMRATGC